VVIYLDTSAFVKTVWIEAESTALAGYIGDAETVSSALLAVEARRSALRAGARFMPRTDLLLDQMTLVDLTPTLLESAGRLPDPGLRSLDAVHVATALLLQSEIGAVVTYDRRMLAAAAAHGLPTAAPS
jgi:predicted nucleic acid-binding protein